MPGAARKKDFDFNLFRKRVAHFDDENENERNAFMGQAWKQCKDAGLPFVDAMGKAYGSPETAELREQINELKEELKDAALEVQASEERAAKLQEELNETNETATEAKNEAVRLQALLDEMEKERGGEKNEYDGEREREEEKEYSRGWLPKIFLLLLVALIASRLSYPALPSVGLAVWTRLNPLVFWIATLALFVLWCGAEYRAQGFVRASIRALLFCGGFILTLYLFIGLWPWSSLGMYQRDVFVFLVRLMPYYAYFLGSFYTAGVVLGWIALLLTLLAGLSNIPERLAGRAGDKMAAAANSGILQAIRRWF
jgi:hypothetical protein